MKRKKPQTYPYQTPTPTPPNHYPYPTTLHHPYPTTTHFCGSLPPNSFFRSYIFLTLTVLCNMIRCYFCLSEGCNINYCCYVKKITNLSSFTLIRQKTRSMQLVYAVIINGIQAIPKSYLCNIPLMFTASSSSANEQCRAYDTERAAVSLLPGVIGLGPFVICIS